MGSVFSPSTRGFYPLADRALYEAAGTWPADGAEVSDDEVQALLQAEQNGKVIQADANGKPVAVDPPPPSTEQCCAAKRAERDHLLASTQWLVDRHREQMDGDLPTSITPAQYKGLLAFRQALRDLPNQAGFPDVKMPDPAAYLPAAQ